jgi:membrane protease YdiL (CAAX protease family)
VGLACGWLYWRKGLLAAMLAHATVDLVLKVAMPMIALSS